MTREAARSANAVAIGEIGLDYHYDFSPRDVQRAVFEAQIAVALELDLPGGHPHARGVRRHGRRADAGGQGPRARRHALFQRDDRRGAPGARRWGFYISFSGILTFPKADALRDVARFVPRDRLLIETDAPFLAPVPHRGKRNEPAWVAQTLQRLAAVRSCPVEDMDARDHG